MNVTRWIGTTAVVVGAMTMLVACGGDTDDASAPATVVVTSTAPVSTVTITSSPVTSSPVTGSPVTGAPELTTEAAPANVVSEGSYCSSAGSTAAFADGATAYCAHLAATDALVWSRTAGIAPNPALADTSVSAGSPCHGYQTGSFAYDASGTQLVCSDYTWQVNVGQRARTEWGDGQAEWAECLESNTAEQCREQLNP